MITIKYLGNKACSGTEGRIYNNVFIHIIILIRLNKYNRKCFLYVELSSFRMKNQPLIIHFDKIGLKTLSDEKKIIMF